MGVNWVSLQGISAVLVFGTLSLSTEGSHVSRKALSQRLTNQALSSFLYSLKNLDEKWPQHSISGRLAVAMNKRRERRE